MSKPLIAIVGRPNVGKSTLFNALAGENISIVKDTPGITRDRIYADIHWLDMTFTLIDTGGIEPDSKDVILSQMREQAEIAMETADVIIFLVDVKQGLVDADSKVADMLRRSHKPVVLVVNKVDSFQKYMADVYEFYNLGIGDPWPISAANRMGIGDMLDEVVRHFPEDAEMEEEDDRPKIAIVGKPNVGKSSLFNTLLNVERAIVTDIAGTTRDVLKETLDWDVAITLIDTAGIRDNDEVGKVEEIGIEYSKQSADEADLVLFLYDASKGMNDDDKAILDLIKGKNHIVIANKSDLISEKQEGIFYLSTRTKEGLDELKNQIKEVSYNFSLEDTEFVTNKRQQDCLERCRESLVQALEAAKIHQLQDLISIDLKSALLFLDEITGEVITDDILNNIFDHFCIGK